MEDEERRASERRMGLNHSNEKHSSSSCFLVLCGPIGWEIFVFADLAAVSLALALHGCTMWLTLS